MADISLYIFGDSYAATQDNQFHHYFEYSWPRKLEKTFDVKNYAVGGSGPQDVCIDLHNLVNEADKTDLKNSTTIIVLPDIHRYNFSFFEKRNHSVFGQLTEFYEKSHYFVQDFLNTYDQEKYKFITDFNKYYLEHTINWQIEEARYLSYFDNMARFFKQTLVWSVNPLTTNYSYQNIDIAPIDLESIARHEEKTSVRFGQDSRLNHISLDNHNIMLDQLHKWIFDRKPIENKFFTD